MASDRTPEEIEETSFDGGCACGHVRYRMTSRPLIVHACHCYECQRLTGAAFAINAMIEATRVVVLGGDPVEVMVPSASGKGQKIYRCPKCQVAVWSHYALEGGIGDMVNFIRVGTLDDPDMLPPDIHIFTESKQKWLDLPEGIVAVDIYYDRKDVWPEESNARRAALDTLVEGKPTTTT